MQQLTSTTMASFVALRVLSKNYHGLLAASIAGGTLAGDAVQWTSCEEHPPKRATNLRRRVSIL
jgi:hypothetical protein